MWPSPSKSDIQPALHKASKQQPAGNKEVLQDGLCPVPMHTHAWPFGFYDALKRRDVLAFTFTTVSKTVSHSCSPPATGIILNL